MSVNQHSTFTATSKDILFIAPSAYPLGGIATWLDYIVPGLRARDWNVTIGLVEGRFHDVDAYLDVHPDDQVLRIPYGTGTKEGRVRQLVRAIRRARPNIVLTVHVADVAPAINRIRERSQWSPHVATTLHALQADQISSTGIYAGVFDAVVCTNRLACELVARSTSVDPDRIYYAPYGIDISDVATSEQTDPEDILRIAYVGRLLRIHKRIEDIGAIVAELNRRGVVYELMIAGGGSDEGWLRVQLADAVRNGRVRFLGVLTGTELADQVYSRADALLITSLWETGPIVAWEAMANQVTVVTSAYIGSGLEGSLKSGHNCLTFAIGDAVGAADCLQGLRDMRLRRRLIQGGMALVAARYSRRVSIEQWNSCLRKIAARPPQPLVPPSADEMRVLPAGRLDQLFGRQVGETIRELLSFKYDHKYPREEWPDASLYSEVDEEAFLQLARSLDCRPQGKIVGGHPDR